MYDVSIDTNSDSNKIITIAVLLRSGVCGGSHEWNVCVQCMGFGPLDM